MQPDRVANGVCVWVCNQTAVHVCMPQQCEAWSTHACRLLLFQGALHARREAVWLRRIHPVLLTGMWKAGGLWYRRHMAPGLGTIPPACQGQALASISTSSWRRQLDEGSPKVLHSLKLRAAWARAASRLDCMFVSVERCEAMGMGGLPMPSRRAVALCPCGSVVVIRSRLLLIVPSAHPRSLSSTLTKRSWSNVLGFL